MVEGRQARPLERVGLFPLPDVSLLPHQLLPLHVFEPRYRQLVEDASAQDGLLAVPRLRPGYEPHYHGNPELFDVCGLGRIVQRERLEDGCSNILVRGLRRVRLVEELRGPPYRIARVQEVVDTPPSAPLSHARLLAEVKRFVGQASAHLDAPARSLLRASHAAADGQTHQLDYLSGAVIVDAEIRQALLEQTDPSARLLTWVVALEERCRELAGSDPPASEWN